MPSSDPLATILIVEDSPVQAELLRRALEGAGYAVIVARDGAEGLATAKANRPDVVVSDINMPVMDGYAMCLAIRREASLKATPVILLTMLSDSQDVIRGLNAGADAYLTKPYNIPTLVSRVESLLAYPPVPPPATESRKVEVRLAGQTHLVDAHGPRALNLLVSTYENAVLQNRELTATQQALEDLNQHLEQIVLDKTAELRESERRFRALVENGSDLVVVIDAQGIITYVSPSITHVDGYQPGELLGKGFAEFIHPDDVSTAIADLSALISNPDRLYARQLRHRHKEGGWIILETIAKNALDDPAINGIVINSRDITERTREHQRTAALLQLSMSGQAVDEKTLLQQGLDTMQRLTNSHIGFLHFVNEDQNEIELVAWTTDTLATGCQSEFDRHYPVSAADILADSVRLKQPIVINHYPTAPNTRGLPEGHAALQRFISVPVLDGEPVRMVVGVGNAARDYEERDVETVKLFANDLYRMVQFKRAGDALRESERRFSDMLGNVELVSLMLDRDARITYCNEYLLRLTGWRQEEVIGRSWFELFIPPELTDAKDTFSAVLANVPDAWHHENEILTRSGERRLIRWNNSLLRSGAGDVLGSASIGEDITEQKRAEINITRLNRTYAVLSGINTLIVRTRDRLELFDEACRIAVEEGGFRMSLLAVVDRSTMKIVPVASAGKDEALLTAIKGILSSTEGATKTMVAQAIREKKAVVSNDSRSDRNVLFGEEYSEAGVRSLAVLPLIVSDEAVGVLALYSWESEFFQEEEMKLLTELTGDIAFAIDHIDKQERLDYLAYYDVLTGLANRSLFLDRVAQYMRSAVSGGHKLAVFLIDLERFKNINDSLGRPAGDALLRQVAEWLTRNVGDATLLARVGADHFAVVMPEVRQEGDVARALEKSMKALLDFPFRLDDAVCQIAAKAGIALFPDDGADANTLFKNAEAALKKAKASGDRYLFYTQSMTATVAGKLTLENQLRQALDKEEFVLHYQPKVNLLSGKLTSVEALIRWNDPRTGLVPPGQFIPILEETGLIYEVGRWALRQALDDYLRWRAAGLPAVRIAVNVSPLQLRSRGFLAEIEQVIGVDAGAAAGLELELTESLIMEDVKHSIASLQAIRAMGVRIAIDDFGTGFSSLSYLAKLPVDTLKIDRSFMIDMTTAPEGLSLVSTFINLAHSLKLKVVAEGVETEEQSRLLRLLDCDEMQGLLFSTPIPIELFESRYMAWPPAE
jgi:diguanylate cyclase (GGDEF)-like protein/PAS domain S-box-containing protein